MQHAYILYFALAPVLNGFALYDASNNIIRTTTWSQQASSHQWRQHA